MNALVSLAPAGHNNPPSVHYDEAMRTAKLVGTNFGTVNKNMRLMVVALVQAASEEGYSLQSAITAAKKEMKFDKLDKADYRKATTNFGYARTIAGAWGDLEPETKGKFLEGKITPSTLAGAIVEREKKEVASDDVTDATEAQVEARVETVEKGGAPETKAATETIDVSKALAIATQFVRSLQEQGMQMATDAELVALHALSVQIDDFRANMAKPAKAVA